MSIDADPMANFNQGIIAQFRANAGEIEEGPLKGHPVLLLGIRGAKSGRDYVTPLAYTRDGDRLVVIASKGGAPTNPGWYHNVKANPIVTVEVGTEQFQARAHEVEGAERDRLYDAHAALMPNFAEYQRKTTRRIPVLVLQRIED
ncbi:MAG TPA: nitroreductase family deazaflavin-dependent oxidoreductase [Candidatus Dormibacteraeota bacterium]|nr:nitroreductase family deazaflavin-dependent oxidoreductase [Candidatus Dormibacteraeota bacterium]